jgi:hypothetical protein
MGTTRKTIEFNITESDCHECHSHAPNKDGYPTMHHPVKRKTVSVYRYVYELIYGPQPGIVLRHTCDNRKCINPDHILKGTHRENVEDRVKRKRSARGTKHGRSKLNEAKVLDIYRRSDESATDLAREYGVSARSITLIWSGANWGWRTADLDKDSA